jgi:hypothetical protein
VGMVLKIPTVAEGKQDNTSCVPPGHVHWKLCLLKASQSSPGQRDEAEVYFGLWQGILHYGLIYLTEGQGNESRIS